MIVGRPPPRPIAGLAFATAVEVVGVGVVVDEDALEVATGAAEATRVEGGLEDCTKLNPPTAIIEAMPNSAKP